MQNKIKLNNAKNGIKNGFINTIIIQILPFVSRTIILYILGTEYLGLGGLFNSILNLLNLSELGFSSAVAYILYGPIAKHDKDKVNAVLQFYRKCCHIIGLVVLLIGLLLLPFLRYLISGATPSNVSIYVLYIIYLFNSVISYFLFAYKKILLEVNQRYDIEMKISTITVALQYFIQIILLLIFKNYYIYAVVLPVMTILNNIFCDYSVRKNFPEYMPLGKLDKSMKIEVYKQVRGAFLTKIGDTIYISADQVVISAFLGLTILGIYSNYYYITAAVIAIFAVIHNTIRPIIGSEVAEKNKEENFKEFQNINFIYMWISIWCSCCLLCLYQPFMQMWVGQNNMLDIKMVVLFMIYFYTGRIYSMLTIYRDSTGILWESRYVSLISGITNLVVNILLVQYIGLYGILISSILSSVLISLPGYSYCIFKYYFESKKEMQMYVKDIIIEIIEFIIITSICYWITSLIIGLAIKKFFVGIIICMIIPNLLLFIINFKDKRLLRTISLIKQHVKLNKVKK